MNALNDTKTQELSKSAEGNREYLWLSVAFLEAFIKKEISGCQYWTKNHANLHKNKACISSMQNVQNCKNIFADQDLRTDIDLHHQPLPVLLQVQGVPGSLAPANWGHTSMLHSEKPRCKIHLFQTNQAVEIPLLMVSTVNVLNSTMSACSELKNIWV